MERNKLCKTCGETKPIDQFPLRRRAGKEFRSSPCQSCLNTAQRRRYANNPREQANRRTTYRMSKYRISDAEYQRLLDAQDQRCSICGQLETRMVRGKTVLLSVDHDHETGEVRGLLCAKCNAMLGQAKDNPNNLFAAIQYLDDNGVSTRLGIPTTRETFEAIQGVATRIDQTNQRLDGVAEKMTDLHSCMIDLRETTNDALHAVEGRVNSLERPWALIAGGWRKAAAAAGAATIITGLIAKFVGLGWLPF